MGLGRKALVPCLSVLHFGTLRHGFAEPGTAHASLPSRPNHCPRPRCLAGGIQQGARANQAWARYLDLLGSTGFRPTAPLGLSGSATSKLEVVLQKASPSSSSRPLGLSRVWNPAWSKSLIPDSTDFRIWVPSAGGLELCIFPFPTPTSIHLISGLFL